MSGKSTPVAASILYGALRIPGLFTALSATNSALEGVYRVMIAGFRVIGLRSDNTWAQEVYKRVPYLASNALRGGAHLSNKEIVVSTVICSAITFVWWRAVNYISNGRPSERYNMVAQWIGPIQLNTKWEHPAFTGFQNWWKGEKKPEIQA